MSAVSIHPDVEKAIREFRLPTELGFGVVMAPIMAMADFKKGEWGPLEILPYAPISLDPSCKVFHYAQEIFEGMKAYKTPNNPPTMFRPEENFKRFNYSAQRMAMPEVPEDYFMGSVKAITHLCANFIPTRTGESMYIRPFMFATQAHVGIKPSNEYKFMVIASPSGSYFGTDSVKVLIQREFVRAVKGGTGNVKCGGNYASSLLSSETAYQRGFQQSMWLDAIERKYVEEMSGMNFMCLIDGVLVTPQLTDSILSGITRMSLLELAPHLGIDVEERPIEIDELVEAIKTGRCSEGLCCGTAAIITPINSLNESDGTQYKFSNGDGDVSLLLRNKLLSIQEGRSEDLFGWAASITGY